VAGSAWSGSAGFPASGWISNSADVPAGKAIPAAAFTLSACATT